MKKQFLNLLAKIDALTERERIILFVLATVGILMLGFSFVLEPQIKLRKIFSLQHQANQTQALALQEEIRQQSAVGNVDPDSEILTKIKEAKLRLLVLDEDLQKLQKNLVQADKIDVLLQGILKRNKALQLVSLKSLPVVNLVSPLKEQSASANQFNTAGAANANANAIASTTANTPSIVVDDNSIYKHEVELVLQGNYLDMLNYMQALEAMPERVYWSRSSLQVLEYPKASLRLNLFTLSLEKKWLNL